MLSVGFNDLAIIIYFDQIVLGLANESPFELAVLPFRHVHFTL